jgi:hypothetical protein
MRRAMVDDLCSHFEVRMLVEWIDAERMPGEKRFCVHFPTSAVTASSCARPRIARFAVDVAVATEAVALSDSSAADGLA